MMEENKKYFITLISKDLKGEMCIGYMSNLKDVETIIKANTMKIRNNISYIIVNKVSEGLFNYDPEPRFYNRLGKLLKKTPKQLKNKTQLGFGVKL